ncbi:hypothetical protein PstZobell_00917, partial [Stutzerimonas stutzeri ATCC 14405 = CCUG 16156]|uniref:hypothetical protein n=1 Tax=Stutzerimonas stutzeri TaxID=316 RepID=UPI0002549605
HTFGEGLGHGRLLMAWRGQFKKGAIETCLMAIKKNPNVTVGHSAELDRSLRGQTWRGLQLFGGV